MKKLFIIALLCVEVCLGAEDKIKKRGVLGESILVNNIGSGLELSHGSQLQLDHAVGSYSYNHPGSFGNGLGGHEIDLGSTIDKHITITKNIGVPVLKPYAVPIVKKIAVPIPQPVAVPVDKPYAVPVPKPYALPVDKPYPVTIEKAVPYPVNVPVKVPVSVPVAVSIPKPVPVAVHKPVPIVVPEPVKVIKSVPIAIKAPVVSLGSGSLGYTYLGNGAYALGSGSIGFTGHSVSLGVEHGLGSIPKLW